MASGTDRQGSGGGQYTQGPVAMINAQNAPNGTMKFRVNQANHIHFHPQAGGDNPQSDSSNPHKRFPGADREKSMWERVVKEVFTEVTEKVKCGEEARSFYENDLLTRRDYSVLQKKMDVSTYPPEVTAWLLTDVLFLKPVGYLDKFIKVLEKSEDSGANKVGELLRTRYIEASAKQQVVELPGCPP